MREDLLGYLLDALDDADRDRVEEALMRDPQLRRQLADLKQQLGKLDVDEDEFDPPEDLFERTCDRVQALRDAEAGRGSSDEIEKEQPQPAFTSLRGHEYAPRRRDWSLADTIALAGVFLVAATLFFPAIARSRFQSHVAGCECNLMQLGQALSDYSEKKHDSFPRIPISGNRAVAGIYAPILVDEGYLADSSALVCSASALTRLADRWHFPTLDEVDQAHGFRLAQLQRAMGGSYGYTLGYLDDGRHCTPRNEGRTYYALMSDAPSLHLAEFESDNHSGLGQNVLFEDNHVRFVVNSLHEGLGDRLFVNRRGLVAAGTDKEDAVIGTSASPPIRLAHSDVY